MGKVEKWVVLGVLALIVGILVVSLTVDDPLKRKDVVMAGGAGGATTGVPHGASSSQAPGSEGATRPADTTNLAGGIPPAKPDAKPVALLNSSVSPRTEPEPSATAITAVPAGSILKTMDGLEPSYMTDMKFYTWKSGDTFPALAQRYYGDLARLGTLRRVNEGRTDVQPGDRVLVPVYDLDAPQDAPTIAASAAPRTPSASGELSSSSTPTSSSKTKSAAVGTSGSRVHVVQEGESLWVIAKKELGAGTRWKEIYDSNRDQLSSPEALHAGIKLRMP